MITTKLQDSTIYEILLLFPKRLSVEFALYCAKSYAAKDKESLKCVELVEKWLVDSESVTAAELEDAADAAYAANPAYSAGHSAAHSAFSAAFSAASAAYSATSACAASSATEEEFKLHLINMIEERHAELELILMEVI